MVTIFYNILRNAVFQCTCTCTCKCNSVGQLTHCFRVNGHITYSASFSHNIIQCLLGFLCVCVCVYVSMQRLRRESVGCGGQADDDNMDSYQPLGQGKHMPIYMYMQHNIVKYRYHMHIHRKIWSRYMYMYIGPSHVHI